MRIRHHHSHKRCKKVFCVTEVLPEWLVVLHFENFEVAAIGLLRLDSQCVFNEFEDPLRCEVRYMDDSRRGKLTCP